MNYRQFEQVVKITAEYLGRDNVKVIKADPEDYNGNTGFFMICNPPLNRYAIGYLRSEDGPLFKESTIECNKRRCERFITNAGFTVTDTATYVFAILHEFGHLEYMDTMHKHGLFQQSKHILNLPKEHLKTIWDKDEFLKARSQGDNIPYMLRGDEMYCDGFAMTYFIPVYNLLMEQGIIEG